MYIRKQNTRKQGGSNDKDAVVGDIVNPYYSTLAYRFYDFNSGKWDESSNTLNGYYGQGFISVTDYVYANESNFLISEDDSGAGCWSRVPYDNEVEIKQLPGNDPLITDSNAIGYKDYAILAYALDMDEDPGTTADRELFIQLYSYKDKCFYPAIRCTDDITGVSDLVFEQANDTAYLYYLSDGDIKAMDIGYLLQKGLLKYEIGGKTAFLLNKLDGVYKVPETVVYHKYDTRTDALGNKIRENEIPIDEFMVKSDGSSVCIVWGEGDITYKDGIQPNSAEASLPENYYREHHMYAARQTVGKLTSLPFYEEDGVTQMTYPAVDEDGNTLDYTKVEDINGEVGKVQAGDPVILEAKPTEWSDPVRLTEEQGANYNDLDFEILPDGNLRAVFVKGFSIVTNVAGKQMAVENVNNRSLMTTDFDVNEKRAEVELEPVSMPKPKESVPIVINVKNMGLNALEGLVIEINQISGSTTQKVAEEVRRLKGGEKGEISLLWQVPENPADTKLQVIVKADGKELCSTEQNITAKSIIDVKNVYSGFAGRSKLRIAGAAINNGNIAADNAKLLAEVSGKEIGYVELGSLAVDETKNFEFYADISDSMFTNTVNEDGSVSAALKLSVYSEGGTGKDLICERYASQQDVNIINNVASFELRNNSNTIPANVNLNNGSEMDIVPYLTYTDENMLKPRVVYVSSNDEVADFQGGVLLGKKAGTATITAYTLPPKSEMILSQNSIEKVDNLETLPEAAVKVRSYVVNVVEGSGNGGTDTSASIEHKESPKPDTSAADNHSTISVTAKAVTGSSGKSVAVVTAEQIKGVISKVLEELAKKEQATFDTDIKIKVEAPADAKSVKTVIPTAALKEIVNNGINALTISSLVGSITFGAKPLVAIISQAAENVEITMFQVDASTLSDEARRTVDGHPVFDFSVTSGDKTISQFGGNVSVSVPYTPKPGEDTNAIVIYYINAEGKPEIVSNCAFDPAAGCITFNTSHFSKFAVGYNKVSFKDVAAKAWYNKAVSFIAARSITTGTGSGNYSPGAKLTRGEFLVMMMRAYGIKPDASSKDNFKDAGSTYYTGYLAAAKRLGISDGTGNSMFAPDKEITRQEMFTLLYNALKVIGELPKGEGGKQLSTFSDAGQVAFWAKDAMTLFTQTGTVGGDGGKLSPASTTTRAEMAQVLYNLLAK